MLHSPSSETTRAVARPRSGGVVHQTNAGAAYDIHSVARWMWVRKVKSVELYNEPNLDDGCSTSKVWLDHLRIRAAALRNAYADLNAAAPVASRLTLQIGAPTLSQPKYAGTLGQVSAQNIHAQFPSGSSASWKNFDRYTFHVAGGQGYFVAANYQTVSQGVHAALGPSFPVDVTEYNTLAGSSFEKTTQTMDTAQQSADFGDIAAYLLPLASRSFVFKFSQTPKTGASGVQKNGLLFGENTNSPWNIGDSSRTFEVYQTIIDHCLGGKKIYAVSTPAFTRSQFSAWGVQDGKNWYLYVVNDNVDAKSLSISLAAWGVPPGVPVLVNEISSRYVNQVAKTTTVSSSKKVTYSQPGFSVSMLTIPKAKPKTVARSAAADAQVLAGSNQGRNYGGLKTLGVKLSAGSNHDTTAVSYLKFNTGLAAPRISAAVLQQYVIASGSKASTLLVLGVSSSRISANAISYFPAPKVAGHITVAAGFKGTVRVDVTHYLKAASLQQVSFQLSRIVRFNANAQLPGDSLAGNSVTFGSRQAGSAVQQPKLVIYYS